MIGIVYYSDDPYKRVFRTVHLYPWETEEEFKNLSHTRDGIPEHRQHVCVLEVVDENDPRAARTHTPSVRPDDPVHDPTTSYVGFSPTDPALIEQELDLAEVGPNDVIADFGCGDGRVLVAAAKRGVKRVIGIDIDPQRVRETEANLKALGITFAVQHADVFETALPAGITVCVCNMGFIYAEKLRTRLPADVRLVAVDGANVALF